MSLYARAHLLSANCGDIGTITLQANSVRQRGAMIFVVWSNNACICACDKFVIGLPTITVSE